MEGGTVVTPPGWMEDRDRRGRVDWRYGADQFALRQHVTDVVDGYEQYTRELFVQQDPHANRLPEAQRIANEVRTETQLSSVYGYHGKPTHADYKERKTLTYQRYAATSPHARW